MGVINDSTGLDVDVVLRTGSITDGMKWKFIKTANGAYKVIPKIGEPMGYTLATTTSNASIYGESISKHSTADIQKILSSEEDFSDFLRNYENSAPEFYGTDYIKTDDINTIIKSSDYLLRIKILEEVHPGMVEDRNTFNCLAVSSFKGNVEVQSTIEIVFPKGSVTQGKEYCVALYEIDHCSPRAFVVSSKYSVFEETKFDNIDTLQE